MLCKESDLCNFDPLLLKVVHDCNFLLHSVWRALWRLAPGSFHPWEAVAVWGESRNAPAPLHSDAMLAIALLPSTLSCTLTAGLKFTASLRIARLGTNDPYACGPFRLSGVFL